MSVAEIEGVTGVKLPPKAQLQRAWWSNNASNNVMTKVWLDAGFRSEQVDLKARSLVFKRVGAAQSGFSEPQPDFKHAKQAVTPRRHPAFGAMKGMLRIEPGTDLTEPALPEWAEIIERKYGQAKLP
jgi:hypothetical protein